MSAPSGSAHWSHTHRPYDCPKCGRRVTTHLRKGTEVVTAHNKSKGRKTTICRNSGSIIAAARRAME